MCRKKHKNKKIGNGKENEKSTHIRVSKEFYEYIKKLKKEKKKSIGFLVEQACYAYYEYEGWIKCVVGIVGSFRLLKEWFRDWI